MPGVRGNEATPASNRELKARAGGLTGDGDSARRTSGPNSTDRSPTGDRRSRSGQGEADAGAGGIVVELPLPVTVEDRAGRQDGGAATDDGEKEQ